MIDFRGQSTREMGEGHTITTATSTPVMFGIRPRAPALQVPYQDATETRHPSCKH